MRLASAIESLGPWPKKPNTLYASMLQLSIIALNLADTDKARGMEGRKLTVMSLGTLAYAGDESKSARRGASRIAYILAVSVHAALVAYCALSVFFGPIGLTAYRRLDERKAAMEANLEKLATIGASLSAELESLKSDPDRAAREARSLGYLRKGETALILGAREELIRPIETGKTLPYAEPATASDSVLKEISLGIGLAVMALFLAPRRQGEGSRGWLRRRGRRRQSRSG
jgi:cell division protein FtsB